MPKRKVTLSFSGCGFLGIYHVGVASCFRDFEDHFEIEKVCGASAGAIAAASYLCGVCVGRATKDVLNIARAARASPVGPLSPRFNLVRIIRDGLNNVLPKNAHEICSGRLSVSLTRCHDGGNLTVTQYATREDLIQVLICSSFVPFYSGMIPPYYKDARYWDGGITNNMPVFDESTITVSPFSGESDICPSDTSAAFLEMNFANHSLRVNSRNVYRVSRALFPPHPQALEDICREGYADALRYIRKVLLSTERLPEALHPAKDPLSAPAPAPEENAPRINSIIAVDGGEPAAVVHKLKPSLLEKCSSSTGELPILVSDAFREAFAATPHPVMRALSYVTLPWVLPLEFVYSTCVRMIELTPRPKALELENFVEIFCSVAQRAAVRILSRHGAPQWLKCACNFESVKMSVSSDRSSCFVQGAGTTKLPHTQSVTFAFAMSIEESSPGAVPLSSSGMFDFSNHLEPRGRPLPAVMGGKCHHERHPGEIKLVLNDAQNFDEVLSVLKEHDDEIVEYFQDLIKAPQPALVISADQALVSAGVTAETEDVIMEIADRTGDSLM